MEWRGVIGGCGGGVGLPGGVEGCDCRVRRMDCVVAAAWGGGRKGVAAGWDEGRTRGVAGCMGWRGVVAGWG